MGHIICFAYPGTKIQNLSDIFIIFASWTNKTLKVIKKALKIIWKVIVIVAIILMTSMLLMQTPMVQTYVANKVLKTISENINGRITFERIHFKPFSNLVVKNFVILDDDPCIDPANPDCLRIDTLARARYVIADFSMKGLLKSESLQFDEVTVADAQLSLVLETSPVHDTLMTNNLARIFKLGSPEKKEVKDVELFWIKRVNVKNMTYMMKNYSKKKTPYYGGINWNDLDINNIYLTAYDLRFKGGVMSGTAQKLSFTEKSGYICPDMSGNARVGNGLTHLTNIRLNDKWSRIYIPDGKMIYENVQAFTEYISKVTMDWVIGPSYVDFKSISYFAPQLTGVNIRVNAQRGRYLGTVDDFSLIDVDVDMVGGGFSGLVNGRLAGIPDVMNTTIEGHLRNCTLTTKGLSEFVTYWMKGDTLDISNLAKNEKFFVNGDVGGTLNNMTAQAVIKSNIGSATGKNVCIDHILETDKPIGLSGEIRTRNLDLGKVIGTDLIGKTTLTLDAEATFGGEEAPVDANIRSLHVDKMHFFGYDYSDIHGEAVISDKVVDGRLTCNDPNLNFMTQGRYGLSRNNQDTKYDFVVMVGDADLNKINLDKRGKSKTRFMLRADFTKTPANDIFGDIAINNLWLENSAGAYNIGNISINSINRTNNTYKVDLNSSFAEGSLVGTAPVTEFIKDLLGTTLKRELPALFPDPSFEWKGNRYKMNFRLGNTMDILAWALPGMYIADNTTLDATLNDRGRLNASLKSQRIAFKKQYLMDIDLNINNNNDMISGELTGSELKVATMTLSDNSVKFLAEDNHVGVAYRYENSTELENRGEFVIHGDLSRNDDGLAMDVKFLPSTVYLNSREWRIRPSNLTLNKDGIASSDVEFVSNDQRIHINGGTSPSKADTLSLNLEQFDLSIVNPVFKTDLGIKGLASGSLQLTSPLTDKGILVDLACDSTYFADCKIGQMNISSDWDEAFQRFNIMAKTEVEGRTAVDAKAKFTPKTGNLEASADLDKVDVGYLQPLLYSVFSDIKGKISGEVEAEGPINDLKWESRNTTIEGGALKVDYTNVTYFVDGPFRFNDSGLYFDDIAGHDRLNGTAVLSGGIKWNNKFQNIFFDINIKCNEIEGINLDDRQNEYFYGNLFGTGNVTFRGPASDIVMNVEATTVKNGALHVPVSYSSVSGRSTLLKFTEIKEEKPIDPYDIILQKMQQHSTEAAKFTTNLTIQANPDVEAYVWIDKAAGHMISGRGNGRIQMMVDEDQFNITGDYGITKGNYKFAFGLVNRDFEIQEGSSVKFNGDILDSQLDIAAIYKTKASIGTLIGDTTSVNNRRTVECEIKITDKLLNPRLQFGIDIPEIDPTIKSRVESALSTEDKVQKQFLSLLLSNSFLPDEQSGIVNNSTMLYTNMSEAMANQLNNILEKLDIPIDLGLKYQPNDKGNDVFDVAVSTQMFNNRVVVNGSVGNKQYKENAKTDVVGDLDIEIKLDRSGAFRLNLFSHSADSYTNYLDNLQRNGVGLTYQTEFSTFKQFIKNIFSNKDERRAAKQAEENARMDVERVTLKIE